MRLLKQLRNQCVRDLLGFHLNPILGRRGLGRHGREQLITQ